MKNEIEAKLQELKEKYVGMSLKKAVLDFTKEKKAVEVFTRTIIGIEFEPGYAVVLATTDEFAAFAAGKQDILKLEVTTGPTGTDEQKLKRLIELQDMLEFDVEDQWIRPPKAYFVEEHDEGDGETCMVETDWTTAAFEKEMTEAVKKCAEAVAKKKIAETKKDIAKYTFAWQ